MVIKRANEKRDQRIYSCPASVNKAVQAIGDKKKKRDDFKVTCFSCNEKGHYAKDYTKPKNEKLFQRPSCR